MRVALLFFGQPRFFDNPRTYNSHHINITFKYDTDVFIHSWWASYVKEYQASSWATVDKIPSDRHTIKKLRKIYNPVHAIYDKPLYFSDLLTDKNNNESHLCSIKRVGKMLTDYSDPFDYDYIILSRLDNIITKFPNLQDLGKGFFKMANHPGVADQLFIFTPEYIDFLNCYESYYDLINVGSIEQIKLRYFNETFPEDEIKTADFNIELARV